MDGKSFRFQMLTIVGVYGPIMFLMSMLHLGWGFAAFITAMGLATMGVVVGSRVRRVRAINRGDYWAADKKDESA